MWTLRLWDSSFELIGQIKPKIQWRHLFADLTIPHLWLPPRMVLGAGCPLKATTKEEKHSKDFRSTQKFLQRWWVMTLMYSSSVGRHQGGVLYVIKNRPNANSGTCSFVVIHRKLLSWPWEWEKWKKFEAGLFQHSVRRLINIQSNFQANLVLRDGPFKFQLTESLIEWSILNHAGRLYLCSDFVSFYV